MSHTLSYILGIIILVVGIGLSVALHELGHMIPAKRFGVKVPEYFIGFGPRVWSTRRGETEYGVKAIWLGGYVRLLGMVPPAPPGRVDKPGSVIAQARQESLAELGPDEQHRAFYRLTVPRKLLVMAGGILTNLVLGVVLLALALGAVGRPAYTSTLSSVSACVPADVDAGAACTSADPQSPAQAAGLRAGDEVLSWNGTRTSTWTQVQEAIAASGTSSSEVVVQRQGEQVTLSVTPVEVQRVVRDEAGTALTGADGQVLTTARPYVGIGPALGSQREALTSLPGSVGSVVVQTLKAIVTLPAGLYHAVAAGLGLEERSQDGLVSLVGMGRIAGEVSSAGSGSGGVPFSARLFSMLSLLGSLNLALFAFNLVPLPPLDGGHVAGALWEGARRRVASCQGRPDPGYADTARLMPVGQVGFVVLLLMGMVLIWVDVVAPL